MRTGVILYGPPASGKDTVTDALCQLDSRCALFAKLKVGSGRTEGYRLAGPSEFVDLKDRGRIVYYNERYGNVYAVDMPELERMVASGALPVVHVGQIEGIRALTRYRPNWLTVVLWCSRYTTEVRSIARGTQDVGARLRAWDETAADISAHPEFVPDLHVDTELCAPAEAALRIHELVP